MSYKIKKDKDGHGYIETNLRDFALVSNSMLNKGMGFTHKEREEFGLVGLIPPHEATLETQCARSYEAFSNKATNIEKYNYLRDLQDSNEVLFYRLVLDHITEMMPIVYTPVVGEGCQMFSHVYRRPRGLFIAYPNRNEIDKILANPRFDHVKAIVVSDGERILGLGDQGAGGMGIPIGKLSLYSVCAGIHPAETLPILLDTGTNNPDLIDDPLYIGWRHERVRGKDYDDFIEAFVKAVKKRFPKVLLQWEDFAQQNANPILAKYRDQLCTFNDDIQGTAAIATGTLLAAVQVTGLPLQEQKIVVVGGGSAGCGISNLMMHAMMEAGLSEDEARSRFYLIDRNGLMVEGAQGFMPFQQQFMQKKSAIANWKIADHNNITLLETTKNVKPTVLVGVSGQPGIFNEAVVKEMAAHVAHPIIFPLSNPTSRSEANPTDLVKWTEGRVVMGTGSPFPEIIKNDKPFRVDQTNNAYIFPGMGLGIIAVEAKQVSDKMFMAAARALADCSPAKKNHQANLLPPLTEIREVSYRVALAVAKQAIAEKLALPHSDEELERIIHAAVWTPHYVPYVASK